MVWAGETSWWTMCGGKPNIQCCYVCFVTANQIKYDVVFALLFWFPRYQKEAAMWMNGWNTWMKWVRRMNAKTRWWINGPPAHSIPSPETEHLGHQWPNWVQNWADRFRTCLLLNSRHARSGLFTLDTAISRTRVNATVRVFATCRFLRVVLAHAAELICISVLILYWVCMFVGLSFLEDNSKLCSQSRLPTCQTFWIVPTIFHSDASH